MIRRFFRSVAQIFAPTTTTNTAPPQTEVNTEADEGTAEQLVRTPEAAADPIAHLLSRTRNQVAAYAMRHRRAVTQWPDDTPSLVAHTCSFHPCALDGVPALLVCSPHNWTVLTDTPAAMLGDKRFVWEKVNQRYDPDNVPHGRPEPGFWKVLGPDMPLTHLGLQAVANHLLQKGVRIATVSDIAEKVVQGQWTAQATIGTEGPNGRSTLLVVWTEGGCTVFDVRDGKWAACSPLLTPNSTLYTRANLQKEFVRTFRSDHEPRTVVGHLSKKKPTILYVAPPKNRTGSTVLVPQTPQEAREVVDGHGVIVPSRSKFLPKSSGKGRGRAHVFLGETTGGFVYVWAKLGKGSPSLMVHFAATPATIEPVDIHHTNAFDDHTMPSEQEHDLLVALVAEAVGHVPKLGNRASKRMLQFAQTFITNTEAITGDIKAIARTKCATIWGKKSIQEARAPFIARIPQGTLVATALHPKSTKSQWTITTQKGSVAPKDFHFLADASRLPTIEDLQALAASQKWSAHTLMQRAQQIQRIGSYVSTDPDLAVLRNAPGVAAQDAIGFDPRFFEILDAFDPERNNPSFTVLGTIHAFDSNGPYSHGYTAYPYQPYTRTWTPDSIRWHGRKGGATQKAPACDLFVHENKRLFCSQKAKDVFEEIGISGATFWPAQGTPGLYYVHVEEDKDDIHPNPLMALEKAPNDTYQSLPRKGLAGVDLYAKPESLEGADLWRSRHVRFGYKDLYVFLLSQRAVDACKAHRLKTGPLVPITVTDRAPYTPAQTG
jgi:hypothetical protein